MNKLCPFCGKEPTVPFIDWVRCDPCNIEFRTEKWNTRTVGALKYDIMNMCRSMPDTPMMQELYDKVAKI